MRRNRGGVLPYMHGLQTTMTERERLELVFACIVSGLLGCVFALWGEPRLYWLIGVLIAGIVLRIAFPILRTCTRRTAKKVSATKTAEEGTAGKFGENGCSGDRKVGHR